MTRARLAVANSPAVLETDALDAATAAGLLEATLLRPDCTREQVIVACDEAAQHGFASLCVNPCHVPLAAARLRGSKVRVATVVGYPLGATLTTVKRFEASECL